MAQGALGATGNEGVQARLFRYLQGGRVHPTLLLAGPEPKTKFQVAKNAAKFLLSDGNFDLNSKLSGRIERNVHPDVMVYQELEESNIKVEIIREFIHQMEVAPLEANAKVCIIDACHRMGPGAANAFLKTLEEPHPNRYFFLLTTQVGSLLPTILSRSLEFTFKPESPALDPEIKAELEQSWLSYVKERDPQMLSQLFSTKPKATLFLQFLEEKWRNQAIQEQDEDKVFHALESFDQTLQAEGRLRSNTNYGLMLENLLRQQL